MLVRNAIMHSSNDIVSIKDLHLKYKAVNDTFLKIWGFNDESIVIDKQINEILSIQNCRIIEKNVKEIIKTKKSKSFTLNLEKEWNSQFSKTICYPIIKNGEVEAILSVTRDETQEENLKLKLVDKVCVINSLLDNVPMIIYMKDKNNHYITGSKYAKKFFQEGIDVYSGNIQLDMNASIDIMNFEDNYVIKNKSVIISEKRGIAKDGQEHWYKIYKAPILDSNNDVNGLVIITQNIDAEKQLELQKELFIATLTHDLKTPLQAQISSLQSISKGTFGCLNENQKEILDMVIESSNFMKEMLYSILSVYKYENGMVRLYKEYFNLSELIKKCIKEAANLAQEKKIELTYSEYINNKIVYADKNQIRRVLVNVLNNAMNHAYKHTTVYVDLCENDDYLITKIKNISAQIPQYISEHIFDKYVSGYDNGIRRGIGLGLYFCKKVLDAHAGKIKLNAYNTNNEFVIEIPKREVETAENVLKFI
ncbi:MAG: PAS domain-containing sensor histidine kinase, partial [Candidatus Gastranaerophilales bacterium]|nr:PAS domain-containing sensor histidine kinase [Candidatus Gastranaerophilales bacterium]